MTDRIFFASAGATRKRWNEHIDEAFASAMQHDAHVRTWRQVMELLAHNRIRESLGR